MGRCLLTISSGRLGVQSSKVEAQHPSSKNRTQSAKHRPIIVRPELVAGGGVRFVAVRPTTSPISRPAASGTTRPNSSPSDAYFVRKTVGKRATWSSSGAPAIGTPAGVWRTNGSAHVKLHQTGLGLAQRRSSHCQQTHKIQIKKSLIKSKSYACGV
jgi:hypothetical protein